MAKTTSSLSVLQEQRRALHVTKENVDSAVMGFSIKGLGKESVSLKFANRISQYV